MRWGISLSSYRSRTLQCTMPSQGADLVHHRATLQLLCSGHCRYNYPGQPLRSPLRHPNNVFCRDRLRVTSTVSSAILQATVDCVVSHRLAVMTKEIVLASSNAGPQIASLNAIRKRRRDPHSITVDQSLEGAVVDKQSHGRQWISLYYAEGFVVEQEGL
jgi:hypothetical protein